MKSNLYYKKKSNIKSIPSVKISSSPIMNQISGGHLRNLTSPVKVTSKEASYKCKRDTDRAKTADSVKIVNGQSRTTLPRG